MVTVSDPLSAGSKVSSWCHWAIFDGVVTMFVVGRGAQLKNGCTGWREELDGNRSRSIVGVSAPAVDELLSRTVVVSLSHCDGQRRREEVVGIIDIGLMSSE